MSDESKKKGYQWRFFRSGGFDQVRIETADDLRHLGELDRHDVLVHAIDAALQDHAADDVPIVELLRINRPLPRLCIAQDCIADRLDPIGKR